MISAWWLLLIIPVSAFIGMVIGLLVLTKGSDGMEWIIIGAIIVALIIDWFIVMGFDPKKWKGGEKDDHSERPDR